MADPAAPADASRGAASPEPLAPAVGDGLAAVADSGAHARRGSLRAAYVLGLALQVLFWFLIFLAIAVAVGAGGHLTEFRYVGF